MKFQTLSDVDVRGKRVVVREDLNVPMKNGAIADETRISAALQTLRYLHEHGAKTIILSHLGRPDGKRDPKYSLAPVAARGQRGQRRQQRRREFGIANLIPARTLAGSCCLARVHRRRPRSLSTTVYFEVGPF